MDDIIKAQMLSNAEKLRQLYGRINETVPNRYDSPEKNLEWKNACRNFHGSYDELAFPGGYEAVQKIVSGDPDAIKAAVCFIECRPYFHRSGYLYSKILRKLKKSSLTLGQKERLQAVIQRNEEYKKKKSLINEA